MILDPVDVACTVATLLRIEQRCDIVIAVTHMRLAEDIRVLNATREGDAKVDLILGGHDHHVVRRTSRDTDTNPELQCATGQGDVPLDHEAEGDFRIIKSGMDWGGLSVTRLAVSRGLNGVAEVSQQIKGKRKSEKDNMT